MFKINYKVSKSIEIKADIKTVWENIYYFKNANLWNPRLILDKQTKLEYFWVDGEVWNKFSWESQTIWTWEEILDSYIENKEVNFTLNFLKPFKSTSTGSFKISQNNWKNTRQCI